MDAPGWLARRIADVPSGDEWLTAGERRILAGMRIERRRAAWRLGRWTAKSALAAWVGIPPELVDVLAAEDGAPEAWCRGERLPVSISLSHRADHAVAVVADAPNVAGCDLEAIEPRSGAFIREWLAPAEQALVGAADEPRRALLANVIWTAKEAAAKVRREGLRLDLRRAVVTLEDSDAPAGRWSALRVDWDDGTGATTGWWRHERGWVVAVAGQPPPSPPLPLT